MFYHLMHHTCPAILSTLMQKALAAVKPDLLVKSHLQDLTADQLTIVGFGKAAAAMAIGVEEYLDQAVRGLVIVPFGYETPCKWIQVKSAPHPIPDINSIKATNELVNIINTSNGPILALVSGGGSSVLCRPAEFVSLQQKQSIIAELLAKGRPIAEINCVRGALSGVKAGGLAKLVGDREVRVLVLSDVAGNNPDIVASGPFITKTTNNLKAIEILDAANIVIAKSIRNGLLSLAKRKNLLHNIETRLIGSGDTALQAAAGWARSNNIKTKIISDALEADASKLAKFHAEQTRIAKQQGVQLLLLLSGGEARVDVKGRGSGGPNRQFLLSLAVQLADFTNYSALAIDTDGKDGSDTQAGAWISSKTFKQAQTQGLDAKLALNTCNTANFFKQLGTSIDTGPTRTNVNDFRAILIEQ